MFPGRYSASAPDEFVVFLIGARLNKLRALPRLIRIGRQMNKMQQTLRNNPDLGCLHIENWNGRTTLSVQYWRDVDSLMSFARDKDQPHLEPWRQYNRLARASSDIGIWHETYHVGAGDWEVIYTNMPRFGLAQAFNHAELAAGSRARTRMAQPVQT